MPEAKSKISKIVVKRFKDSAENKDLPFDWIDFEEMVNHDDEVDCEWLDPNTPLFLFNTSGSSGNPKFIQLTHLHPLFMPLTHEDNRGIYEDDVIFSITSLGWISGQMYTALGNLGRCGKSILLEGNANGKIKDIVWRLIE